MNEISVAIRVDGKKEDRFWVQFTLDDELCIATFPIYQLEASLILEMIFQRNQQDVEDFIKDRVNKSIEVFNTATVAWIAKLDHSKRNQHIAVHLSLLAAIKEDQENLNPRIYSAFCDAVGYYFYDEAERMYALRNSRNRTDVEKYKGITRRLKFLISPQGKTNYFEKLSEKEGSKRWSSRNKD